MIENDLSLEHRKKINDFIILKSKDTFWSKFVLMLGIQMKNGLYPNIIVSIENKDIDETNRFIKLPNISLAFKNSVRKVSSYFISSKRVTLLIANKPYSSEIILSRFCK